MNRFKRATRLVGAVAGTAACVCAMLPAGAASAAASSRKTESQPARTTGGTAYWNEQPGAEPNWIFPYASLSYYSTTNIEDFQQLMYRPLYWLSQGGAPALNTNESLANAPVFSDGDSTVTIPLKGWKWSNGSVVDAQDVVFFFNMYRAERDQNAGYVRFELPDNVRSVTAPSATSLSVTIHFKTGENTNWVLYNELSQITPMPLAWDISKLIAGKPASPGSGGCSSMTWTTTTEKDCQAVWTFMTDKDGQSSAPHEAGDLATYATNPLWQVVDGPWHLSGFDAGTGNVTMVPNPRYSGADKPHVAKFVEVGFASDEAEFVSLGAGNGTVGYLPSANTPEAAHEGQVGPNAPQLSANYTLAAQYPWSVNYFPINFNSNGDGGEAGAIFHQLYIRQALQELVDQPVIIRATNRGYGTADDGPVPTQPVSSFLSSGQRTNPYPYNLSAAIATLKANGWTVKPGAAAVCADGSKCGTGIKTGAKLSFTMVYVSGFPAVQETIYKEVADWSAAGIIVATRAAPFDEVLGTATPCKSSQPMCSWEMVDWGGGWLYLPDVEPSGEYQFTTNAGWNTGRYSDPENDLLIEETIRTNGADVFSNWENYAARQIPVIWQPTPPTLVEISKNVRGVEPLSALGTLNPEDWYFVKS